MQVDHAYCAGAATWTPTRVLLAIGAAGPVMFLAVATIVGLLDPDYDVKTQTVSELARGGHGWIQTANFFIFGPAIIAFAVALHRSLRRPSRTGTLLIVLMGVGAFVEGIFPTDLKTEPETGVGVIHNLVFLVAFLALTVSYGFTARAMWREPGWRGFARGTALMPVAVFALLCFFIGFGSDPGDPFYSIAGLIQRALIVVAFGWMTVTGMRLLSPDGAR
jgi:hypothetical membrane protein